MFSRAGLAAVALVVLAPVARADAPADAKAAMHAYFDGEKTGGYVLVGLGAGGLVAGGLLLREPCQIRQGMAYPLLAVGALHVAAGIYVHVASSRRIDRFDAEIDRDGQAWVVRERDRMAGVSTQFTVLEIVELGLIAGGAGLAYYGWRHRRPKLEGIGLGIAIEAAATFAFDLWAAHRAHGYRDDLDALDLTAPRTILSHSFLF